MMCGEGGGRGGSDDGVCGFGGGGGVVGCSGGPEKNHQNQ